VLLRFGGGRKKNVRPLSGFHEKEKRIMSVCIADNITALIV